MTDPPPSMEYLVSLYGAAYAHSSHAFGTDDYEEAAAASLRAFQDVLQRIAAVERALNWAHDRLHPPVDYARWSCLPTCPARAALAGEGE